MNAGRLDEQRGTLLTQVRRLGDRASAAMSGLLAMDAAAPTGDGDADPAADGHQAVAPRQLVAAFSRRTRAIAQSRLSRLRPFTAEDYLTFHPDVDRAGFDPYFHALFIGSAEGRRLFRQDRLARALGAAATGSTERGSAARPAGSPRGGGMPIGVFVSSRGNVFMQDLARDITDALGAGGARVTLRDESAPRAPRPPICIYVAPHEFFLLGQGCAWLRDEVIASGIMVNTEQPQTRWFARALPFLMAARGIIDLSVQQAALFAACGIPALQITPVPAATPQARVPLGVRRHPLFRSLPTAALGPASIATPFADRPIDIAFFGAGTPHREAWFSHNAGFLADFTNFLYCRPAARGPIRADAGDSALSEIGRHVCGHARIALNLHRDEFGYFEWHRIVRLGLASGSVVVSEPCPPCPGLRPGVHYFEAATRQIPDLIEWLTRTPDGRDAARAVQLAVAGQLAGVLSGVATGERTLSFLNEVSE